MTHIEVQVHRREHGEQLLQLGQVWSAAEAHIVELRLKMTPAEKYAEARLTGFSLCSAEPSVLYCCFANSRTSWKTFRVLNAIQADRRWHRAETTDGGVLVSPVHAICRCFSALTRRSAPLCRARSSGAGR